MALVQQNMDAFCRLFCSVLRVESDHARLVGLRPDVAKIAGGVKMVLEAFEQHLADFNFKEVRDVVVKLGQLGRIMPGAVALCCECEPSVFEELNNLRVSHCETAEAKVGRCTLC